MANINSLQIGAVLTNDSRITVKNGFLGFGAKSIYNATQSEIKVFKKEYDATVGEQIRKVFTSSIDKVNTDKKFQQKDLGNYQLEEAVSVDNQFLAVCLYRYEGLSYQPVMDLKIFEGKDAEILSSLF